MARFIKNVILFVIAIVVIALAVVNRHPVSLSLNPFDPLDPRLTIQNIPLFWIMFASVCVGIVVGGIGAWSRQGRWRKEARSKRREAAKWHREADQLREQQDSAAPGGPVKSLTGPDRRSAA